VEERCDSERPAGNPISTMAEGDCSNDADCVEGLRGRCQDFRGFSQCTYDECVSDDECSTPGPCGCEKAFWSDANACLEGDCRLDADCGEAGYCSPSLGSCGNYAGIVGYWCHTAADACVDDGDCVDPQMGAGFCMFSSEVSHWVCSYNHCVG
jgi:hypothetical protein